MAHDMPRHQNGIPSHARTAAACMFTSMRTKEENPTGLCAFERVHLHVYMYTVMYMCTIRTVLLMPLLSIASAAAVNKSAHIIQPINGRALLDTCRSCVASVPARILVCIEVAELQLRIDIISSVHTVQ